MKKVYKLEVEVDFDDPEDFFVKLRDDEFGEDYDMRRLLYMVFDKGRDYYQNR